MAFRLMSLALVAVLLVSGAEAEQGPGLAKVVNLLKDMQSELEKEQDADEDLYDAFTCWCEANDKGKGKAIAEAEQRTTDLGSTIEMLTAKSAQLTTDISTLEAQIAENQQALEESTALREKEAGEFHTNELDSTQAIGNLKAAVVTLSKHNEASLSQEAMLQLQQILKKPLARHPNLLSQLGLKASHRRVIASLLQQTAGQQAQAPQSGAIFGIMKQMKESFETNLVKAKEDEGEAATTFSEMKAAKTEEINAGTTQLDNKRTELADSDEKNAQSKEDLADTSAQLEADRAFLADVKARCEVMDKMFAERTAVRQDETKAVSEALEVLTTDDARDLMSKSTDFLQTSVTTESSRRVRAEVVRALGAAAKKFHSPALVLLAAHAKEDVFEKVKESIDTLIKQLKEEQKAEVEKKDYCRDELHANEVATDAKYEKKEDAETLIANHDALLAKLKTEIKAANDEITQTKVEIQAASENRMKANTDFQSTVADQKATQEILAKALGKLEGFYSKKASLLQTGRGKQNPLVGAPAPDTFQPYKKKGGAGGVMGMIENIIAESKQVEADAKAAEQEEEAAYVEFTADAASAITALQNEIADKTARVASADGDLVRAKEDLTSIVGELEDLNSYGKELHAECDYVVENFETRQQARTDEMEALEQAKQLLSGMAA